MARVDAGNFYGHILCNSRGRLLHMNMTLTSHVPLGFDPILENAVCENGSSSRNGTLAHVRVSDRRRSPLFDDWDDAARPARKRHRVPPIKVHKDVLTDVPCSRAIKIGDANAIWNFYEQRFNNCQQIACKLIAKAWVKVVEPKKQSTHPYVGGDEKAPGWWPKSQTKIRHKEPDHLSKRGPI